MNYLFLFGRDPLLSYLEIISYLKRKKISFRVVQRKEKYLILEAPLDPRAVIDELGGTVKIAKTISQKVPELVTQMPNKVYYALQDFDDSDISEIFKEEFKRQKIKAQNITLKISPSEIIKKKMLETGSDFVFAEGRLFQTVAVSNPLALEERDVGRPYQDVMGAISLRLAKILVNLSQIKSGSLLDPFCGIGSILQEALLMGFDCIGVDSSEEKIKAAKANMQWLKDTYPVISAAHIFLGDARELSSIIRQKVQVIVTEPYLGELVKSKVSEREAEERMFQLLEIYKKFFEEAYKVLDDGGKMVIILPYFEVKGRKIGIPLEKVQEKFKISREEGLIPLQYGKPTNRISREIYIFQKS